MVLWSRAISPRVKCYINLVTKLIKNLNVQGINMITETLETKLWQAEPKKILQKEHGHFGCFTALSVFKTFFFKYNYFKQLHFQKIKIKKAIPNKPDSIGNCTFWKLCGNKGKILNWKFVILNLHCLCICLVYPFRPHLRGENGIKWKE